MEILTTLSNADAAIYFDDRRARGFNTVLLELFEHTTTTPSFGVPLLNGAHPFTTALPDSTYPDFSLPNDAYFAHVDEIVALAASRGFLVLFTPAYLGWNGGPQGWYQEMLANGTDRLTAFGNYIGRRYASSPNIMWVDGGDFNPPDKTLTRAVANGIKAGGAQHLHTAHARDGASALDYWAGEPWLDVDTVYDNIDITNVPVYLRAKAELRAPGLEAVLPNRVLLRERQLRVGGPDPRAGLPADAHGRLRPESSATAGCGPSRRPGRRP